jgi:P27 family predicted phage terminase small subunit
MASRTGRKVTQPTAAADMAHLNAPVLSDIGFESADPATVQPPAWMPSEHAPEFRRIAAAIAKCNVLHPAHADAIAVAVGDMYEAQELRAKLRKIGHTYTVNGVPRVRPESKMLEACQKRIAGALLDFGLTPYAYVRNVLKAEQAGRVARKKPSLGGPQAATDPSSKFAKFRR